ncbi:hypothetical protein JAO73_21670 [Hymenobacter sp. BT523]|uniref:hypothetical protein n=1 Tax=Hymenobacter sp. BT523 TaxID=2795725 RepID=UPI0018EA42B2|nr:hypothetical protein [Hymenobacter sp. BT523]MBJ6111645.1 hypothetical protein [Hymenobacter sp. BT523]
MHTFNLIGGILLILLCCAVFSGKKAEHDVAQTGPLVPVQVVRADCNASAAFRFLHFTYQGQEHSVKVGREHCEQLRPGQTVQLQHLDTHPDVFLFPGSYRPGEDIAWGALFLLGGYAVISSAGRLRREQS